MNFSKAVVRKTFGKGIQKMKNKSLSHIYTTTCTEHFKVYTVNFLLIKIIYLGLHS